jgi:hypothetical protein
VEKEGDSGGFTAIAKECVGWMNGGGRMSREVFLLNRQENQPSP